MMKRLLIYLMLLAFALPNAIAGEKTVTISRNEGIYDDGTGVYYCSKGGITMTFSSGLNNVNYLVEHQQVVFDIFSTNYVIKKIKFNCLDNTTDDNLDCFYWGPSTISEFTGAPYTPTGTYTYSGYIGTWVGGSTPSKYIKFVTEAKPVRFGSVEITYEKEFGDIYEKVTDNSEIENGQTYALVSQYASKALGKEDYYSTTENLTTFTSTPVTLLDNNNKVKVTDEVQLIKLESSGYSSRPWYIKVGDNYIRRRSSLSGSSSGAANGQGYNLHTASTVTSYEQYFRVSISVSGNTNQNALIRFDHSSSEPQFAIRHYNGGSLFRDMDYSTNNQYAANQRVYLYKPAQSYEVTTECIPSNGGYITLGNGILTDNQGRNWSQHFDNVSFFVGSADGYGIGEVTITDLNNRAVNVLQPTATSDFGNDYSFVMPANDVKVTANFLQPYNIDTICNPTGGGIFNFISGYTDFNGQHKSNEGKTVTFKPIASDGYSFQSVTYTNNGTTTTLTPDANGVFSFVMPGNDVTLTANFEEAHDLYLLGTANGKSGWAPYGPKFTFDGANEKYYIDVYFKGYNDDPNTDPAYGYFSLTKKIDESGNWDNIAGYRLAAENNQTWVADGYSGVHLYGDRPNNSFKIKPGVYRIEVNKEMTEMSITEYPLGLTFDPAGGVPGNGTIVEPNTEVTIGSNLQDLVHAINPNEDPVSFYNSIDNWGTQENDNTRVISNIGETTIVASAALGDYLIVNGSATYEIPSDLYLLGTANGRTNWVPYGPKFTFDETNQEYYIDVYFKGGNDDANVDQAFGYFSLSTRIGSNDNDWGSINGYRIYATSHNYEVADGHTYTDCFQTNYDNAFKIPAGVYRIKVNRAKTQMTIIEYPLTLTFDPVSGSTVAAGDQVTISSNLDELVHGINPNEVNASFKNSTDGGTTWDPDNTAAITAVGATTTVNAEANIGYIVVPGTATYTIPAPTVYNITTQVNPAGSNAGTITAPTGSEAGETVNFTVADTDPNVYTLTGVEVVDSNNGIVQSFEPSADGNYSFTMPNDDVTIHADYERTKYNVTTSWSPEEGGAIWLNSVNTPQTVSVANGDQVVFGVAPTEGYKLISLTVMNETTGQEITPTSSGSNEYTFTMPTGNVSITAQFDNHYNIYTVCVPEDAGYFTFITVSNQTATPGKWVYFTVDHNVGYRVDEVTMSYVDENNETVTATLTRDSDGEYGFMMPAADVTITAEFIKTYRVYTQCIPEEGGRINNPPSFAAEGQNVTFTVTKYDGYAMGDVTVTYVDENNETQTVTVTKNHPYYSFTMPAADVTVTAYFDKVYTITKQCTPPGGGTINLSNYNAIAGRQLSFTVTSSAGYALTDVTLSYVDENDVNQVITLTPGENGEYSFIMPSADVTINANFAHIPYGISTVCNPSDAGSITVASSAYTGDRVDVTVEKVNGYVVSSVTVTNDVTGQVVQSYHGQDGQYHFTMPDAPVTITANFSPVGDLYLLGTYNGATEWDPNGLKFDYDLATDTYSLTVYFKGIKDVPGMTDDAWGHFNLTTVVDESDWDAIDPYRLVPDRPYYYLINSNVPQFPAEGTKQLYSAADYDPSNEFMISAGIYVLTVPGDKSSITATRIPVPVTLTPSPDCVDVNGLQYVTYGTVVTATCDLEEIVHNINPNEDHATFYMEKRRESYSAQTLPLETESGNQTSITHVGRTEVTGFAYIGWIKPYNRESYYYKPLRFLEGWDVEESRKEQIVCDTLIGVWAAERILWAKDIGNKAIVKDVNDQGSLDYGIEVALMQDAERGWDQSNWIKLDFTDYLEDMGISSENTASNNAAALEVLNRFVNKQLKPMSVKGYFCDDNTYRIMVDSEPEVLNETIGYPGYLQDPLELLANPTDGSEPVTYYYNHYTPCNFMCDKYLPIGPESDSYPTSPVPEEIMNAFADAMFNGEEVPAEFIAWIMSHDEFAAIQGYDFSDMDSWTDEQWNTFDSLLYPYDENEYLMFFVRGKTAEVAHVWAVWRGDDIFDVYERGYDENGEIVNWYDLSGAFKVGGWQYNRLTPSPVYFGQPEGEEALKENCAYEFHIAIETPGTMSYPPQMNSPRRAPVAKGCDPMEDAYLIYPLDLTGSTSYTSIPEVPSVEADKTVVSVRYYNLMGQESKSPFDGVNIVVTRYSDGSVTSKKILR
jgi:hypothetical protein